MISFSEKQTELIKQLKTDNLKRINLLEGAVRSGKTWISLILFALWVAMQPIDATFLMVGKTLTSLKRNCLDLLQSLVGESNFTYNTSRKEGTLFGRTVYLEGTNDMRAEGKIRGMTLTGAYCDEITLFTEDFFAMLLSRLSRKGAKLFATTNPDSPQHWLMVKYIKRASELDMNIMRFTIDDNPHLDSEYVTALKKEYTGVFYKRFILGQWVVADGACYPQFANNPEDYITETLPDDARFISIGVDWGGNRSLTAFVATVFHGNYVRLTVIKDYHIDGKKGEIDGNRVNAEFIRFINTLRAEYPQIPIRYVFADSAEQYLINGLRQAIRGLGLQIGDSKKNAIVQRIICANSLLNTGRLKILKECKYVIDGLRAAVWDSKAAANGKDERLDDFTSDIDVIDAFEYSFERFISQLTPR
jgi:PBSX family phage terminase large subunit